MKLVTLVLITLRQHFILFFKGPIKKNYKMKSDCPELCLTISVALSHEAAAKSVVT